MVSTASTAAPSGDVPADGAELPAVLDHGMEEAETEEQRLEDLLGLESGVKGDVSCWVVDRYMVYRWLVYG